MVFISKTILLFTIIILSTTVIVNSLLWPQYSVLQVTAAGSIPLVLTHKRKSFFDYGVQMNYNLPYDLKEFYNVPIWPKIRRKRATHNQSEGYEYNNNDVLNELNSVNNYITNKFQNNTMKILLSDNNDDFIESVHNINDNHKYKYKYKNGEGYLKTNSIIPTSIDSTKQTVKVIDQMINNENIHPSDMTAGELYGIIEDFLKNFGYDETCLLKTICEHARHPFNNKLEDDKDNSIEKEHIIEEIISLILSPSIHNGFTQDELEYKHVYEKAELYGNNGHSCDKLYPDCNKSILDLISSVKF